MHYNNEWAIKEFEKNGELGSLCFWGHHKSPNGELTKSCFSQWYEVSFEYENQIYLTAEHWMMAEKARLFDDLGALSEIMQCKTSKEAKKIGRRVKGFNDTEWLPAREKIVKNGNYLKFTQNESLWSFLDSTGDKVLVEASPYDRIWGIGMKQSQRGVENPNNWKGLNLLGYALMEVRDLIRAEK